MINEIKKVHDTLLRLVQILCNGREVSSPPTSIFLVKQQVVSQRMTNDVLSAKNSDISDNSAADLSYRERLEDAVAAAKFTTRVFT